MTWSLPKPGGWLAVAGAWAVLSFPDPASAQAICSAPHSSPTMAQSGSLSTLPAGGGWVQVAAYGQVADRFFGPGGSRQSFLADSEFTTRSVFLTGAIGVTRGVELWGQVPFHRLRVESAGGNSNSTGFGDIRAAMRISPRILGLDLPLAARFGVKIPGSDFPVDATILPLTEGQRDWEITLESGSSLMNGKLYAMGWVGYRWREMNDETDRDPGDEAFAHLAVGGVLSGVSLELAVDGLRGRAPMAQGFLLTGDKRRLVRFQPTIGIPLGSGRLEANAQIPVSGRNLAVGTGFSLGYRLNWGLLPDPAATLEDFFQDRGGK